MPRLNRLLLGVVAGLLLVACSRSTPELTATVKVPPVSTENRIVVTVTPRTANTTASAEQRFIEQVTGPASAFLTITVYSDFQCQVCVDVARSLLILRQRYPNDLRVVFRYFPQAQNDKSMLAAQAAEAAADQGKFWEMHDLLFALQAQWITLTPVAFRQQLSDYAKQVGVADLAAFNQALDTQRYARLLDAARLQAEGQGFKNVPGLAFNGSPYSGRIDEYALDGYSRLRLLEKRWYAAAPALQIDLEKRYTATLITERGTIEIELFPKLAPVAVNNFVFLARQGWYNNITWHVVDRQFAAQTGDPSGTGFGMAGYRIVDEFSSSLKFDKPGVVAMAKAIQNERPNSASSQFFITYDKLLPAEYYDGKYTIFGQVTAGMDVLRLLTPRNPFDERNNPNPPPGDKLLSVTITEQ